MWQEALVLAVALAASVLAFFSGFGLGTLLLPAFAFAFPLDVAIAATAVVHLANNLSKGVLVGRRADRNVVLPLRPSCAGGFRRGCAAAPRPRRPRPGDLHAGPRA